MRFSTPIRTLAVGTVLLLALSSCSSTPNQSSASSSAGTDISSSADVSSSAAGMEDQSVQSDTSIPAPPIPGPGAASDSSAAPASSTTAGVYNFEAPAPETAAVENSYFKDAAFVGDSRTDGFLIYSGIGQGKNLTSNGLSIFKLSSKKALTINGKQHTLLEALALEQYSKVYLSLGVNELGYYDDQGFYDSYCKAIDSIRELQPNAVIYIQGLIPLNEQRVAETSKRSYLENNHLRIYNDLMQKAAQEKHAVFLDLYSAFADENGSLPYNASQDGVHLSKEYCQKWLTYLQTHTVDHDTYFAGLEAAQTEQAPASSAN